MIPNKTIDRLCAYRRILFRWHLRGKNTFHSHELAQEAAITAAQVRRDLMALRNVGTPQNGYLTAGTIAELGSILEGTEEQKAVLVGAGKLGNAILSYFAGRRPNLRIVAAFDSDPAKAGTVVAGCPCLPLGDLDEAVRRHEALVAILTVPGGVAQQIATDLVGAGIRAIINFTPVKLKVPEGIYVDDIDFSIALEKAVYFGRMLKAGPHAQLSGRTAATSEGTMHAAQTKRILCVDDDVDVVESYRAILERAGYEVAVALDGESGFAEAKAHKPDLIILDVMMRDATEGFHIAYRLRGDAAVREVPILMLTAISSEWHMKFDKEGDGAYLPVDAFVDKPAAPDTLLATVKRLLGLPKDQINVAGVGQ